MAVPFDTLQISRTLKDAGFDEQKADAIVSAMRDSMDQTLATKADLQALELRMTIKLGALVLAGMSALTLLDRFLG